MWLALFTIAIPWQTAFVASAFFLIPRFGAAGLAGAYLAGMSVALIATAITAAWIGKPTVTWVDGDGFEEKKQHVHI